jgi:hypothetical protein
MIVRFGMKIYYKTEGMQEKINEESQFKITQLGDCVEL